MRSTPIGVLFFVALAVAAAGCSPATRVSASTGGRPSVLRVCYSPSSEEPQAQSLRMDRLESYLSGRLGLDVELYKTSGGYGVVIEAMRAKKVDVATLGPFGYLIASEKAGAEAIVVSGSKSTGHGSYLATIAVPGNSPYRTVDDLLAHGRELSFSFVDPASTSGYLVQRAYLESRGVDPDTVFGKTMFSMNHVASAMTLVAGKVDAAAVMDKTIVALTEKGKIRPGDVRVLWTSPPLPSSPIAVRKELPADLKQDIQRAFVEMADRDPELWRMWPKATGASDPALLAGTDAMFDGLREMARNVDHLSLLER